MPKFKIAAPKYFLLFFLGVFTLVFSKISAQIDTEYETTEAITEDVSPEINRESAETDYEPKEEYSIGENAQFPDAKTSDESFINEPTVKQEPAVNIKSFDAPVNAAPPDDNIVKKESLSNIELSNKDLKEDFFLDIKSSNTQTAGELILKKNSAGNEEKSSDIRIASKPDAKNEPVINIIEEPGKKSANELITLEVKDLDLKDVIKIISRASGLNIIMDNDVKAKVTISLKDVTWQTALDNVLKTNELTYKEYANIVRVMTLATYKKEEETMPVSTRIITLNFAKAADLQQSLNKMLSARGNIQININTNSMIVTDTPDIVAKIEELSNKLDIRTPQVIIEALLVSVKLTDTEKLGLNYTITHKNSPEKKVVQSLAPSAPTIMDMYYGKTILPLWNISAQLSLFAEDKKVKILANPRILTLDNLPAQIEITEQVPYTFVSQSTEGTSTISTTQFKDIGIKLFVTPHITKDKFISLSVKAEQSFVASFVGSTNEPSIDSRKVETNFMLKDADAVVIGGLKKKDKTITINKIPLLGDIPVIGKIFTKKVAEVVNTELLIFISPHIMESSYLSDKEEEKFKEASNELTDSLSEKEKKALRNKTISDVINTMDLVPFEKTK